MIKERVRIFLLGYEIPVVGIVSCSAIPAGRLIKNAISPKYIIEIKYIDGRVFNYSLYECKMSREEY